MLRRRFGILVAAFSATALLGVSGIAAASSGTAAPQAKPKAGGTLIFLHQGPDVGVDPTTSTLFNGTSSQTSRGLPIYDVLLYEDQRSGEVKPKMAESMTTTNGLVWTIKVRSGIKFTDNTDYDAEAVRFNIARAADPNSKSPSKIYADEIASMRVVDKLTLEITLKKINAGFNHVIARQFPMIASPTAVQAQGANYARSKATPPVGAGPFKVKDWLLNDLVLERNPDYYIEGKPLLDEVIHRFVPDEQQRVNALRQGQSHLNHTTATPLNQLLLDDGMKIHERTANGGSAYHLNMNIDPRVRHAIGRGIDWEKSVEVVYAGFGDYVENLLVKDDPNYDKKLKLDTGRYSRKAAQKMFSEVAKETGKPVDIEILGITGLGAAGSSMWDFMQAELNTYDDVNATLKLVDIPTMLAGCANHSGFMSPLPDVFFDPVSLSAGFKTGQPRNCGPYSVPEVDAALDTLATSVDAKERKEALTTLQKRIIADAPVVFFARAYYALAYNPKVIGGVDQVGPYMPFYENLYMKKT